MHVLLWIVDGLVTGWLTGKILAGDGYDLLMDTIMGIGGGVAGGLFVSAATLPVQSKMIYANLTAVLGTLILTASNRYFTGRRQYATQR
jgi:uncharacterized membrane protein YeaQ/YmgE (transglycosylase-associated protein family)